MDTRTSPVRLRIERVRDSLRQHGLQALLVPSSDPHLSEYLPPRWQARPWLSGFTGSMGTLVVTLERAAIFADSRYWVQAAAQLADSGIDLVKIASGAAVHHIDWLIAHTPPGAAVAVDGQVLGLGAGQQLRTALARAGRSLRTDLDLIEQVWPDRPGLPQAPVYAHAAPQATEGRAARLARLRAAMAERGATHHVVSTVDDIARITNLRGADVEYNPVFLAHLLVAPARATLFVGDGKLDAALRATLAADGIDLADYGLTGDALAALPADAVLLVDPPPAGPAPSSSWRRSASPSRRRG